MTFSEGPSAATRELLKLESEVKIALATNLLCPYIIHVKKTMLYTRIPAVNIFLKNVEKY